MIGQVKEKRKMLVTQCRKLAIDLKAAIRQKEVLVKQREDIEQRIIEVELENSTTEQKVKC
jgi:hypothetical protein